MKSQWLYTRKAYCSLVQTPSWMFLKWLFSKWWPRDPRSFHLVACPSSTWLLGSTWKGGRGKAGKAPGCLRHLSPECFMHHFHSHSLGRIGHSQLNFKGGWETEDQTGHRCTLIFSATRSQDPEDTMISTISLWPLCYVVLMCLWCQNWNQVGWPIRLTVIDDGIWTPPWPGPGHSTIQLVSHQNRTICSPHAHLVCSLFSCCPFHRCEYFLFCGGTS